MRTAQELADRLAELAGWYPNESRWTREVPQGWDHTPPNVHPFPVGSLDALEAFRREQLPGWWFYDIGRLIGRNDYEAAMVHETTTHDSWGFGGPFAGGDGPDEWTARAAALIAAKETP